MLKDKRLIPCAQVSLIMAPDVGEPANLLSLKNITADSVITKERMNGGINVGGKAVIFNLNSDIHTMLKETA